ncbi:hypothetical protein [Rippkaea orientalis]|nr:hypothetical protein [Rippkaea orientalis]
MIKNSSQQRPDNSTDSITDFSAFPQLIFGVLWLLAATYTYLLLFSPPNQIVPGYPIWAIQPETITEVINESLNFFFILPLFNLVGIKVMQSPTVPPVSEAIFNLAEAWIFMFLPLLLADPKGRHLPRFFIWICAMFLTNVFLIPYMAMRLKTQPNNDSSDGSLMGFSRSFAWVSLSVGITAILWGFIGRPDWGDLGMRLDYLIEQLTSDRVTIAFTVDLCLFWLFQPILLGDIIPNNYSLKWVRFIPFFGLAFWLIKLSSQLDNY